MDNSKRKYSSDEDDDSTSCYGPSLPSDVIKNTRFVDKNVNKDYSPSTELPVPVIGPVLPPHLQKQSQNTEKLNIMESEPQDSQESESKLNVIDSLSKEPPVAVVGPILPPHLQKQSSNREKLNNIKSKCEIKSNVIGPVLPPDLANLSNDSCDNQSSLNNFGPALPPNFKNTIKESSNQRIVGPSLPSHMIKSTEQDSSQSSEDDEDAFGPLPPDASQLSGAHLALEERALHMKMDQLGPEKDKPIVREEWMLELPEVKAAKFGLGPRQFRSKTGPDMSDRSSWTKVAGKSKTVDKEIKVDLKKEAELRELERRNKEQEKIAKRHKRKEKSLMESYQEELNKKKKDEGPSERRPFSRDIDLQVNRFDEAQKKAVLKKAQLLDDRFSSGKSKFL